MRAMIALALTTLGLAACAPTDGATPITRAASGGEARQCFTPNRVVNFTRGGPGETNLRTQDGGVFVISSDGCLDMDSAMSFSLIPLNGISDRLCVGDSARIVSTQFVPRHQCRARVLRSLTEAEVAALPALERP